MSFIQQEIAEQPEILRRLLTQEADTAHRIADAIRRFDPTFVCIAARGTSDNAARYARYLLGIQARLVSAQATPSIHTLYQSPPNLSRALVIGISQSGQPEDVRQVVTDARAQGALTVTLTNDPASPLAQAADYHLPLCAGEEISIAATKTYTAELTAVAMLVAALLDDPELHQALARLPDLVAETLTLCETIPQWVQRYRYMEHFVALGRGYNYCTAFEISLKIEELCYVTGQGLSEADFRHGPIATIQSGFPVIVIAPQGKTLPVVSDLLAKLRERQAECLVISNDEAALAYAQNAMPLPRDVPEWLSPVVAVIPGQIFAMRLALARGLPVDQPRGLTKVTMTR